MRKRDSLETATNKLIKFFNVIYSSPQTSGIAQQKRNKSHAAWEIHLYTGKTEIKSFTNLSVYKKVIYL